MDEELERRTHQLLSEAAHVYQAHPPAARLLRQTLDRFTGPLRLAVAGAHRAGKSTLVNALIGEHLAPVDGVPFVSYRDGTEPQAWCVPERGRPYPVPVVRTADGLRLGMDAAAPAAEPPHRAVVRWPSRVLRRTELIDTGPAAGPGEIFREADAVLRLTSRIDDADLEFLMAGRGLRGPSTATVHTILVLGRADATAGGQPDAMLTARQAARRSRRDPRVAALCQDVVAVSPLIGQAARTLRDDEFHAFAAMARLPRSDSDPHLLSTDRFTAAEALHPVGSQDRIRLLHRFGLGGIRLAVTLTRTGTGSPAALAERLQEYSGLKDLQASIAELFTARRAALKTRSALTVLDQLLRTEQLPPSAHLLGRLELLLAGAHEFRELRLLSAVRSGRITLPKETAAEARRLLGGAGTSLGERLGLTTEAAPEEIWVRATATAVRWRQEATRRDRTPAQRRASETVLRSCETITNSLGDRREADG